MEIIVGYESPKAMYKKNYHLKKAQLEQKLKDFETKMEHGFVLGPCSVRCQKQALINSYGFNFKEEVLLYL
jgi:hypothetical protein